jgi:serine/threonine protein kinase
MEEQGSSLWEIFQIKQSWKNLSSDLIQDRYCSIPSAVQIGIQLTKQIQNLHSIGYLHLDIKPDNILINRQNHS